MSTVAAKPLPHQVGVNPPIHQSMAVAGTLSGLTMDLARGSILDSLNSYNDAKTQSSFAGCCCLLVLLGQQLRCEGPQMTFVARSSLHFVFSWPADVFLREQSADLVQRFS